MAVKLGNGNWAVKEDKLLAYNDNSGLFFNKEFDFSRGTSATYVAKDGLIKTAGIQPNIVTNGDFSNGSTDWTLGSDWTVADGKATYGANANGNALTQSNLFTVSGRYRVKFTISDIASGQGRIYMSNTSLSEVYLGLTYVNNQSYSFDFDATATNNLVIRGYNSGGGQSFSISNITVQQIETDTPRIDFTNDTKGHLLLEPSRTNLFQYSEDFSGWSGYQATSNTTTSPSGSTVLFLDFDDARMFPTTSISNSTVYTSSIYLKANKVANVKLRNVAAQDTIISLTTDWVRYEVSATSISTSTNSLLIDARFSQGLGASGLEIAVWGAQVEAGSYATSYIPTTGSASTRNADVCNNSGSAQDFNSEEGVLYAEIAALYDDLTSRVISISDGTSNEKVQIAYQNVSNRIKVFVFSSSNGDSATLTYDASDITDFVKVAVKYKSGDYALWVDGIEVETKTDAFTPTGLNELAFDSGNGSNDFYGKVRNLQVFTEALTDEQLEKLTS